MNLIEQICAKMCKWQIQPIHPWLVLCDLSNCFRHAEVLPRLCADDRGDCEKVTLSTFSLQDKSVVVVSNQKEKKIRGIASQGFLLCTSNPDHTEVVTLPSPSHTPHPVSFLHSDLYTQLVALLARATKPMRTFVEIDRLMPKSMGLSRILSSPRTQRVCFLGGASDCT